MHSHYWERGTRSFLYTERSFWNQKAHYFFCEGLSLDRIVRQEILSAYSPCILMTVVRMLFFYVLNLTIFVKRGRTIAICFGWVVVCVFLNGAFVCCRRKVLESLLNDLFIGY
jgi:hypothetical protein